MRPLAAFAVLLFASVSAYALAPKPGDEARRKQREGYSLEIVDKDEEVEGKVVGSCEAGTEYMYHKIGTAPRSRRLSSRQR